MTSEIPDFNKEGLLPEGIHVCSGYDFIERFCKGTTEREDLTKAVIDILDFASSRNAKYVFVGGSFVTNNKCPKDLDVVIAFKSKEHIPTKSERLVLAGRRVDIMFCSEDEPTLIDAFIHLLSNGRFGGNPGVIQIEVKHITQAWKIKHMPDDDTYEIIKRVYFNRQLIDLNEPAGILITVHGLLSTAQWNSHVVPIASSQGWIVAPYSYGFQTPEILFNDAKRKAEVEKFREWLFETNQSYGQAVANVSVIAHSFGTYLVGKYLDGFSEHSPVTFNCIILTGSILEESYDWSACAGKKVARVRNEIAPNDQWVKWIPNNKKWLGLDPLFGKSGINGFTKNTEILTQHSNEIFDHNNVIKKDIISSQWLPYLNANKNASREELSNYFKGKRQ